MTLSLFDWRPAPAEEQCAARTEPGEVSAPGEGLTERPAERSEGLRIIIFDCETTGINFQKDQVIELCVQHGLGDQAHSRTWRIRPSVPIHPAAQAVHGIALEDLAGCPQFAAYADEIIQLFAGADVIVGYNISFDIEMLQAELARIDRQPLDLSNKKIVDAFRLWQQCEPRSLQHAHRRFVGDEFAAAHSASADVAATGRVLVGMLEHFKLADQDWHQIAKVCDPMPNRASWVGPSRHLRWEGEAIVVGFGKHAGIPLHEIAAGPDRSFLQWVMAKDFPHHVVEICKQALERSGDELVQWARERFGEPAPTARPPFNAGH
ncbi:MAG: 3'-5' exonuclease [Kofleriaceae bacterium]